MTSSPGTAMIGLTKRTSSPGNKEDRNKLFKVSSLFPSQNVFSVTVRQEFQKVSPVAKS